MLERAKLLLQHRLSRAVVEFAKKQGVTVLVMEDLTGIGEASAFLKRWPYYDLQEKIQYKAARYGIQVEKVDPRKTSQRCTKCGHIEKENRKGQAIFKCVKCGQKNNADYNAALNLATPDIENLISETI